MVLRSYFRLHLTVVPLEVYLDSSFFVPGSFRALPSRVRLRFIIFGGGPFLTAAQTEHDDRKWKMATSTVVAYY